QDNEKVYRLIKALYGLRQAPRAWNIKLDNTLKSLDFKKCALEQAIYTKKSKDSILLIGVYVDDLIITGTPKKEIDKFKAQMEEKFEMSDLGLLAYYLGIEVTQTNGDINSTEYRSLIGCLRYLLHTRPDLSYSIGLLSHFIQEPREQHMKAIRQVLRYVKGTKDHGITYKHNGGNKIHGYSDSSYGVNTQEEKGTTGIIFYYGESPISWSTQKQATVALSSCESEFIAATAAATQALWLKRLLSKLTHTQEEKITIQVDNKSAIALMKNPVFHGRSKHIDTKYHFIRECVEREDIQVEFLEIYSSSRFGNEAKSRLPRLPRPLVSSQRKYIEMTLSSMQLISGQVSAYSCINRTILQTRSKELLGKKKQSGRHKTYEESIKYKKANNGYQEKLILVEDEPKNYKNYKNTEELLLVEDEPKNYKEASTDQKWIEAMKVELDSINRNNTWELTTLPKGHKAIGLKWVFKTKKDANGNIIKHKARLVAKGYIQQHGIDFEEVFAPVARMETIRLLLAIAANNKWEVHHLDVKSAFLHGDLKEEVYVTQPEGFIKRQDNGKVYRLIKALYGLRQAPRAWNIKLDNTLKSLDFKKCALEQAIYTKKSKDSILLIGVYVDDLIITGTPKKEIDKFKAQMEEKFEMSDLGLLAYYLGIEVTQTNGDISIKQSAYASKILKEAGMIDCNETLIPMDPGTRLTKITEGTMVNSTEYRSLIGCLRYLLHTRPDLSYSVGLLSRFMQEPREQHMKAIRQVLRYVKGTKDHGITYKSQ
ncbi:ribonuclease H-like domain, reverse transcriptase, RNA-dependent DNA polymerase, partial [Tanacetum coccineum]